jgi:hypothetical protein
VKTSSLKAIFVAAAILAAGAIVAAPSRCSADDQPGEVPTWLRTGAHLRLLKDEGKSKPVDVWYLGHDDSMLFVEVRGAETKTFQIDPAHIKRFEVSQERSSCAWNGFVIGWLAGGATFMVLMMADPEIDSSEAAGAALISFGFFGPVVGLVGSLIGSGTHKDRWVEIWDRDGGAGPPGDGGSGGAKGGSP